MGKDAIHDWENRWSHVAPKDTSVNPFDREAARSHNGNEGEEASDDLPEPTPILDGATLM
jgi:hypothetical protein